MFCIVEFVDERTVEVIPSNWIVGQGCFWPPYKPQAPVKAVIAQVAPLHYWKTYKYKLIKKFETYSEARQFLGRAEYSDLQSDVEGDKRKRRANPMYEDYDRGHRAKRTRLPMEQSCSSEDEEQNQSLLQLQPPPPLPQFSSEPQSFMEQLGPAITTQPWSTTSENKYWKDALRTILHCMEEVKSQVADLHRKVDLVLLHNTSGCEDLRLTCPCTPWKRCTF
ncbi:hypothetical protein SKAU_G00192760 [Synaphobranchus kaupii]|uniref:Uncharacterized protein n=1 Tax=Synaphobranchus kaupii TaxID=118154 RepID=A0A9Q1IVD2_SYNKA|nr:hypothetical protein SKAU_G00192760 [Synaphobranchus kaupii]